MLSKAQIRDINKDMLGLGKPDAADRQGYSKADYSRMKDIGMLILEYTDEEAYSSLRTMCKYKNTQLKQYASDIDETLEHYEEILKAKYNTDDIEELMQQGLKHRIEFGHSHGPKHYSEAYRKLEIKTIEETDSDVVLELFEKTNTEFFEGFDIRKYNGYIEKKGREDILVVAKPYLRLFAKDMTFLGRYGYKPDEALDKILKSDIDFKNDYYTIALENTGVTYDNLCLYIYYISDKSFKNAVKKIEGVEDAVVQDDNLFVLADKSCEEKLKTLCSIKYYKPKNIADFSHVGFEKITDLMRFMCEYCKTNDPPVITDTQQKNKYGYRIYKIGISNKYFTKALWALKGKGLMYVSSDENNTYISSTPDMLPFLTDILDAWHITISQSVAKYLEPLTLKYIGRNQYGSLEYEINTNNYSLQKQLWEAKDRAVKFVDSKTSPDKIKVSTTRQMLPELIRLCKELHINTSSVEKYLDTSQNKTKE